MRLKRVLGVTLCLVMVVTVFSSLSSAQVRRPLRWLGHGYSDGYNRCNPGPISNYYNPYSAHNSRLVSQSPNGNMQEGSIPRGIPFSVYASPKPVNEIESFKALPGVEVDNSFVPYKPKRSGTNAIESLPGPGIRQEIETGNKSDFVPRLPGQADAVKSTSQSAFSDSGFQVQPKVNHENLFDPFGSD